MAKANKAMEKELDRAQGVWEDTTAAEVGGKSKMKDGDYVCKLKEAVVELSKNSNRLQVKTVWEVVEPEKSEGKEIRRFDGLNEQGAPYLKAMFNIIGFDAPSNLKKLGDALESFVEEFDKLVDIALVTKDGFQNVYVNGISGDDDDTSSDDDDDTSSDDDDDDDASSDDDDSDSDDDEDEAPKKKAPAKKKGKK